MRGLAHRPLFAPAVGRWRQGMVVEVPLQLHAACPGASVRGHPRRSPGEAYAGEPFVVVAARAKNRAALDTLDPEGLNGTNRMRLYVFGSEKTGQARLVAVLDNLGKGAGRRCGAESQSDVGAAGGRRPVITNG